jgi:hypothetical protein
LEKRAQTEVLRAFVDDGLDCGFSRQEVADLYATFFEDRLAEALALALLAGDYPHDAEFTRRIGDVMRMPEQLFRKGQAGRRALPIDDDYFSCIREATVAVEGAVHRFVEGDYPAQPAISAMLRVAYDAMLAGNVARAYDRVTAVGARVLEGEYLARPTDWMETEPLYSWLLGIERLAHVRQSLEGWPSGRYAKSKPGVVKKIRRLAPETAATLTRPRREVIQLLMHESFGKPELTRMRRNQRWLGPELLRLMRLPDDTTKTVVVRNIVRTLGAIQFEPAVDDLLGLLMRSGLNAGDHDGDNEGYAEGCEEALVNFGVSIKDRVLHHLDLALVDTQRLALARILGRMPADDTILHCLESMVDQAEDSYTRYALVEIIAGYRHPRSRAWLSKRLAQAEQRGQPEMARVLRGLMRSRRGQKSLPQTRRVPLE